LKGVCGHEAISALLQSIGTSSEGGNAALKAQKDRMIISETGPKQEWQESPHRLGATLAVDRVAAPFGQASKKTALDWSLIRSPAASLVAGRSFCVAA
jgi:hypothetical protein